MGHSKRPGVQRVTCREDLARIRFVDNVAEIEVPIEALDVLPLKNEDRAGSARLRHVEQAIRREGYNNLEPVVVRIGRRGRWVVVNGGHRLTAARRVAKEFWTNLFGRKVRSIYFLVYRTPLSDTLVGQGVTDARDAAGPAPP